MVDVLYIGHVCYKILYLLSGSYIDMFSVGLVCKRLRCRFREHTEHVDGRYVGFRTVGGKRHGERIFGVYTTHYDNGTIMSWKEYTVPVLRWRDPSLWSLKCHWTRGRTEGVTPYAIYCWYEQCSVKSVELVAISAGASDCSVLKRFDWCIACLRELPLEAAGMPASANLGAIESFLLGALGRNICSYASSSHGPIIVRIRSSSGDVEN